MRIPRKTRRRSTRGADNRRAGRTSQKRRRSDGREVFGEAGGAGEVQVVIACGVDGGLRGDACPSSNELRGDGNNASLAPFIIDASLAPFAIKAIKGARLEFPPHPEAISSPSTPQTKGLTHAKEAQSASGRDAGAYRPTWS